MIFKDDFKSVRWVNRLSRGTIIVFSISLLIGLNLLAARYFVRTDTTHHRKYSLTPESLAYIKQIEKPVDIIVTIPPHSNQTEIARIYKDVHALLQEYEYASHKNYRGKIQTQHVNPFEQTQKAKKISTEYGVTEENVIIVASGDHHRQILPADLYTFKDGRIESFKGEQALTSAILDVTNPNPVVVYSLVGHGEMRMNEVDPLRGLTQVSQNLQNYNIDVHNLNLSEESRVPTDAAILMIASPQTPLLQNEVEKIRRFLSEDNGRLMVFLDPGKEHGLGDLLYEWGIIADDMFIFDTGKDYQASGGDLIVRHFVPHPITHFLIDNQLSILAGPSRPVRPDMGAPIDDRRTTTSLLATSNTSWGERAYHKKVSIYDEEVDLRGPIPIATLSERSVSSQLGIKVPGGRLIIFGNSDFIANNHFNALGNKSLFQNSIYWCLDRTDLLNIPPRHIDSLQLTLSREDLLNIGMGLAAFPSSIACIGLIVFLIRRR